MEAVVLSLQKHTDRASILHAYTRSCGRINYMVYGARSRKKGQAVYSPLSIVEVNAMPVGAESVDSTKPMTLREASLRYVPEQIPYDVRRQSVALFMAEVLQSLLRHPMKDERMYDFLVASIYDLDKAQDVENVHLRFLVGLCRELGFAIDEEVDGQLLIVPNTREERQRLLRSLCQYIEKHVDDFQYPKSLDVLMALFD